MKMPRNKQRGRFKVGDWVTFQYGGWKPIVQIIEERGPLGFKGDFIYRIRLESEGLEPDMFEVAERNLEPAKAPA
jgi:hypothetical protein